MYILVFVSVYFNDYKYTAVEFDGRQKMLTIRNYK